MSAKTNASGDKVLAWQIINTLAFLMMIVVNALASYLPLNGVTTAAVSNKYFNLFTPAGVTFAVWGVIYVGLLALTLVQGWPMAQKAAHRASYQASLHQRLGLWFASACLLNASWLFAWHYDELALSMVIMLCLVVVLERLHGVLWRNPNEVSDGLDLWCVRAPVSLFYGWITLASIANMMALYKATATVNVLISEQVLTIALIAIGACIVVGVSLFRRDPFYAAVATWGFFGITVRHGGPAGTESVFMTAAFAAVAAGITGIATVVLRSKSR